MTQIDLNDFMSSSASDYFLCLAFVLETYLCDFRYSVTRVIMVLQQMFGPVELSSMFYWLDIFPLTNLI